MDDYAQEIGDLKAEIERLAEAEEDPQEIAELQMQLDILQALYGRARELHSAGQNDADLKRGLKLRGYGEWSLENVYAFVYEAAIDLPGQGHHDFLSGIRDADFAAALRGPQDT